MKQYSGKPRSVSMRIVWLAPLLFSGVVACQEEHESVNTPPAPSHNLPGVVAIQPPTEPRMPTVSQEETPTTGIPRNITGEVVSIEGKTYVIKDQEDKEIRIEANSMTLIDESIGIGDKAEIRYSADEKPIAIRKIRGT
jgi:hypothetical protein